MAEAPGAARAQSVYVLAQSWAQCSPLSEAGARASSSLASAATRNAVPHHVRACVRVCERGRARGAARRGA
jgi:hypothetical protein